MISREKYPLDVSKDNSLSKVITARAIQGGMWYLNNFPEKKLCPSLSACTDCHSSELETVRATRKSTTVATVYTPTLFLENFEVYNKICKQCAKCHYFDGRALGLVNFRNTDIFPGK